MITKDGHIIEATRKELLSLWQHYEVYELMSFEEYLESFKRSGAYKPTDEE